MIKVKNDANPCTHDVYIWIVYNPWQQCKLPGTDFEKHYGSPMYGKVLNKLQLPFTRQLTDDLEKDTPPITTK